MSICSLEVEVLLQGIWGRWVPGRSVFCLSAEVAGSLCIISLLFVNSDGSCAQLSISGLVNTLSCRSGGKFKCWLCTKD